MFYKTVNSKQLYNSSILRSRIELTAEYLLQGKNNKTVVKKMNRSIVLAYDAKFIYHLHCVVKL